MSDKGYIARLEEENRNYNAMIDEDRGRNPQLVKELREKIQRNIVSIESAKTGTE